MTLSPETEELTRALASLTDAVTTLRSTLDEIKEELQWANNNGPTYAAVEDPRGEVD